MPTPCASATSLVTTTPPASRTHKRMAGQPPNDTLIDLASANESTSVSTADGRIPTSSHRQQRARRTTPRCAQPLGMQRHHVTCIQRKLVLPETSSLADYVAWAEECAARHGIKPPYKRSDFDPASVYSRMLSHVHVPVVSDSV